MSDLNTVDIKKNEIYAIAITHFINPHHFYFKIDDGLITEDLIHLENEILRHAKAHGHGVSEFTPVVGNVLAFSYTPWNKWIRARVDTVIDYLNQETKYILWALDYGYDMFYCILFFFLFFCYEIW